MSQTIKEKNAQPLGKWALIIIAIMFSLGLVYLLLRGNPLSQLIGFFTYMSVASTFIPLPTPPYVIALGDVFDPGIVAFVAALGSCSAALIEYPIIDWFFSKSALQQRVKANRFFQAFYPHFKRSAFVWLVVAAFTPIPLEPFRFTVILTRYNIPKYLLALFIGRFGCYYIMARIGEVFMIPMSYIIIMVIILLAIPMIGIVLKGEALANDVEHAFVEIKDFHP